MSLQSLFSPIRIGNQERPNRVFMAPLTRCRAPGHIPTPLMAEYYAQRATAGLIIAEATMVMPNNSAFYAEPGIHDEAQVRAWREVTDAVHHRGGAIYLQLWHGGRACFPGFNGGAVPVAPSAIAITDDMVHTPDGKKPYAVPRALTDDEIPGVVAGFRQAALNARAAGFDGVEIHGANGYLIDSFLRDGSNQRQGPYGGPLENRARLLTEVVDAVAGAVGPERTGVRISPLNSYNSMRDSDPVGLAIHVGRVLSPRGLAYLHVMRADLLGIQSGDVLTPLRDVYRGTLIANMGYSADEAAAAIAAKAIDAVAFGSAFLANPDLPARFRAGAPLNNPDPRTFYSPGPAGYTDYPALEP